jgi:hypothetical protein
VTREDRVAALEREVADLHDEVRRLDTANWQLRQTVEELRGFIADLQLEVRL